MQLAMDTRQALNITSRIKIIHQAFLLRCKCSISKGKIKKYGFVYRVSHVDLQWKPKGGGFIVNQHVMIKMIKNISMTSFIVRTKPQKNKCGIIY